MPLYRKEFENTLPTLLNQITIENFLHPTVVERVKQIVECTSLGGDLFCGSLAVLTYRYLEDYQNINEKLIHQIMMLGWSAQMVHSYFLILDDLDIGPNLTHWCYYDASLLRSFVSNLLKLEFENSPSYAEILHVIDKAFIQTGVGNHLDLISRKDYKNFTNERYNSIVDYRTTSHTFKMPIYLAMNVLKNKNNHSQRKVDNICSKLGRLRHMQEDYLDCYGEELDQSGLPKHSFDIQQGKCTWLALTALQHCTPAQRIVFTTCYGSKEPAHIERVKLLYDQLQMPTLYKEANRKMCDCITDAIEKNNDQSYNKLFLRILNDIKRRDQISG